ncbi:MAG: RIP metalloprotease RseP [Bacteroidales bacterium]|nr:RIP metalloprotease RseP [Bacteroidales bacterium]
MEILIKVIQLLLSLSILVLIHEFGHFMAAKIFKTKVEKFYLFFHPWFSLLTYRKGEGIRFFRLNKSGKKAGSAKDDILTTYGIGWLPLGGYVKIAGMIDESLDKEQLKKEPEEWEFRTKPAWQRLIIMLGGVTMNIILAIFIYITMLIVWGEQYLPAENVKYGIVVDSLGMEMGLRNGDIIVGVDNDDVKNFNKIPAKIILDQAETLQVIRGERQMNVVIPDGFLAKLIKQKKPDFISVRFPFEVEKFKSGSPAKKAGMKKDDKIISLNDKPIAYFDEFRTEIGNYKNQTISVGVLRETDTIILSIDVPEAGLIGVFPYANLDHYFELNKIDYSFFGAIPAGFSKTYYEIGNYFKQLGLIFSKEVKAYESVGGFITIGNIFPSVWDWQSFWMLTAFLSIMLAILNVLPIPALDGGHVLFLIYEIVAGRKPSDKFLEYAQITGMILLFALLIFANANDIIRLFR